MDQWNRQKLAEEAEERGIKKENTLECEERAAD